MIAKENILKRFRGQFSNTGHFLCLFGKSAKSKDSKVVQGESTKPFILRRKPAQKNGTIILILGMKNYQPTMNSYKGCIDN